MLHEQIVLLAPRASRCLLQIPEGRLTCPDLARRLDADLYLMTYSSCGRIDTNVIAELVAERERRHAENYWTFKKRTTVLCVKVPSY